MKLNEVVFKKVSTAQKKIVVVTKYYDVDDTNSILPEVLKKTEVLGVGENRTETLKLKKIIREKVHYIGRIQSRKIPEIIKYSATVHSLASLKHARIFNEKLEDEILSFFIQVNAARDPSKEGILPEDLPEFLNEIKTLKKLKIIGLSSMGWGDFEIEEKEKEFRDLVKLRNLYLPGSLTSAGTSRDYEIALQEGIDIVRVGAGCFSDCN